MLILDVARFKYPPHWVPISALFKSMRDYIDASNNQCRGYMRLTTGATVCILASSCIYVQVSYASITHMYVGET